MKVEVNDKAESVEEFPFLACNKNYSGNGSIFFITGFNKNHPNVYEGFCVYRGDEKSPLFDIGDFSNDLSSTNLLPYNGSVTLSND